MLLRKIRRSDQKRNGTNVFIETAKTCLHLRKVKYYVFTKQRNTLFLSRIGEWLIVEDREMSQQLHLAFWRNSYGLVYVLFYNNSVFNLMFWFHDLTLWYVEQEDFSYFLIFFLVSTLESSVILFYFFIFTINFI
jgi:hypothetical protein